MNPDQWASGGSVEIINKVCEEVINKKIASVNQQMLTMAQVRAMEIMIFHICCFCS